MTIKLHTELTATLELTNRLVGGIPSNPNLIEPWIRATMKEASDEDRKKIVDGTLKELPTLVDEKSQTMWTTFKKDSKGIYIEGRQVKSMFKENANILRELLVKLDKKAKGEGKSKYTNYKSKLAERLFVTDEKIYFQRDGKTLEAPDGAEEKAIHVMTAQGERDALKRFDFVSAPAQISFKMKVLNDGTVTEDDIKILLEHASLNGLGADRSQGNGLFKVVEVKELP